MRWGRLAVANHRGVLVPRALGLLVASVAVASTVAYAILGRGDAGWIPLLGSLLVFGAGLVDDLAAQAPRGFRGHLTALASGRVTTGILKVVVTIGASVLVVADRRPGTAWEAIAGVVLLAACSNVWNGLDVRPGRALKAYAPAGLAFVLAGDLSDAPFAFGLFLGALVALPLDLREAAMLGDGGSNLVGFVAGLGLYVVLPAWALALAAAVAVALNVVAETVTFSRVIDRAGPLRWLDALGRLPAAR